MSQAVEIFSKIGIFVILALRTLVRHLANCSQSVINIFHRVCNIQSPENKFTNLDELYGLVTGEDDGEDGPEMFTDEQVISIVNKSADFRKKKGVIDNDFYQDDDDEEDTIHNKPSEQANILHEGVAATENDLAEHISSPKKPIIETKEQKKNSPPVSEVYESKGKTKEKTSDLISEEAEMEESDLLI